MELNVKHHTLLVLVRACGIRYDILKFRGDRRHSSVEFRGSDMASSRLIEAAKRQMGQALPAGHPAGWEQVRFSNSTSRHARDIMNNAAVHYRDAREGARAEKCHLMRSMRTHLNNYIRVSESTGSGLPWNKRNGHFSPYFYASFLSNRLSSFRQFMYRPNYYWRQVFFSFKMFFL